MKTATKTLKEANIIIAAENAFRTVGFKNAKMDDIAAMAGITKVTLYAYFQSKENLYMAITHKAVSLLVEKFSKIKKNAARKSGLEAGMQMINAFMNFCEANFLYSEALLNYFSLIRTSNKGTDLAKLPEGIKDSIYFEKMQEIQNQPFIFIADEISRGKEDGSVAEHIEPMVYTVLSWANCIGYIKLISSSGRHTDQLLNVSLRQLKDLNLKIARDLLSSK